MIKFITRKHRSRPGSSDAAQGVARGPAAGRNGETMRAGRKPNGTDWAAGRTCSAQRRSWPVGMDRTAIELASCAHKRAGIVKFAPRWWGEGRVGGAS